MPPELVEKAKAGRLLFIEQWGEEPFIFYLWHPDDDPDDPNWTARPEGFIQDD